MEAYLICPNCGNQIPLIDCEKTTYCEKCDTDWRYDNEFNLVEVEDDDDVWMDR